MCVKMHFYYILIALRSWLLLLYLRTQIARNVQPRAGQRIRVWYRRERNHRLKITFVLRKEARVADFNGQPFAVGENISVFLPASHRPFVGLAASFSS